jgi:hypothetical protein
MIKKYKKKPVVIEAVQWEVKNIFEVKQFLWGVEYNLKGDSIYIPTLEGVMETQKNDYIIKGVNGEFYPCKPDIFKKTYEEVK